MNCTPDPTGVAPRFPVAKLASYPNPFSSATQIEVSLSAPDGVALSVYSVDGRLIRSLGYRVLPAGETRVMWDGTDDAGNQVASGIYLVQVEGRARAVGRVTLVR
jgi:flagellar hook assembly protein FlgD